MRARGQGLLALAVAIVVVAGGIGLDRLGPKPAGAAQPGDAPSGAWYCPHGGGPGWRTVVALANPGATDVTARITTLGSGAPRAPATVAVPAGGEVRQDVASADRGASTFVEYFGGWIAAGWTSAAGGSDVGVSAEPCAPDASRLWYAADNKTQLDDDAYVVVMNPFSAPAIFDVALFTTDRAPIRDSDLTDVSLRAHRSVAVQLNPFVADEEAVMAEVSITSGRAAVASLGVTKDRGVRSALAWPGTGTQAFLPVAAGSGQSQIAMGVPGDAAATVGATLISGQPVGPVQALVGVTQDPLSAHVYPFHTSGASATFVQGRGGAPFVAALRSIGTGGDLGSTAGTASTAHEWIVPPSVVGSHATPGVVLVNPGPASVRVTLHLLPVEGSSPAADVSVTVKAASSLAVPPGFLASAPGASVLVRAQAGVVAMGASTSVVEGRSAYALAMGLPVPAAPAG